LVRSVVSPLQGGDSGGVHPDPAAHDREQVGPDRCQDGDRVVRAVRPAEPGAELVDFRRQQLAQRAGRPDGRDGVVVEEPQI
jgi:hypothetical protein